MRARARLTSRHYNVFPRKCCLQLFGHPPVGDKIYRRQNQHCMVWSFCFTENFWLHKFSPGLSNQEQTVSYATSEWLTHHWSRTPVQSLNACHILPKRT